MSRFLKYEEFIFANNMCMNLLKNIDSDILSESIEMNIEIPETLKQISNCDSFPSLVELTYGLIKTQRPNIDSNLATIATLCALGNLYYVDEKIDEVDLLKQDIQYLLEELMMNEVGNGIIENISNIYKSILMIYNSFTDKNINSFIDLYTSNSEFIKKISNTIRIGIEQQNINLETIASNLAKLSRVTLGSGDINTTITNAMSKIVVNNNIINEKK